MGRRYLPAHRGCAGAHAVFDVGSWSRRQRLRLGGLERDAPLGMDGDVEAMDHVSSFLRNAHESVVESCLVRDASRSRAGGEFLPNA